MPFFDWEPYEDPCDELPEDVCSVSYCDYEACVYDTVDVGVKRIVAARLDEDSNPVLAGCEVTLSKRSGVNYPALEVATASTDEYKDGSSSFKFNFPIQEIDHIPNILITDDDINLLAYNPGQILGTTRIGAESGSMGPIGSAFPALIDRHIPVVDFPEFLLGARAISKLCSTGQTGIVQLLKVTF